MSFWSFIKNIFKQEENDDNSDLESEIKRYADLLTEQYKTDFTNLNYSLESLRVIDKIFKKNKSIKHDCTEDNIHLECEKIAAYILQTLKTNYEGDILWDNHKKQPVFIFNNDDYEEFYPYNYVRKKLTEPDNQKDTFDFITKFNN